ncbi:MAG: DoxX family protein [Myxococcaceae bacterium]
MPTPDSSHFALWLIQVFVTLFLAILFLQSGMDKVMDWRGNLGYLQPHFAKSPLAAAVPVMLLGLTVLEVSAGVVNGVGLLELLVLGKAQIAFWGTALAALSITALFFGQRMAKEYSGAAVLVAYFLLSVVGLWVTSRPR